MTRAKWIGLGVAVVGAVILGVVLGPRFRRFVLPLFSMFKSAGVELEEAKAKDSDLKARGAASMAKSAEALAKADAHREAAQALRADREDIERAITEPTSDDLRALRFIGAWKSRGG